MLLSRYQSILFLQYLFLVIDLVMNTINEMLRFENVILLVLYVIQDLCIVFAVIVVLLLFFNTYIFQAGLLNILVNKFRVSISVTFVYFILCVALHVWGMTIRWYEPNMYIWDRTGYRVLHVFQRTGAVVYYYYYKRTALKLGNPLYYEDSDWLRKLFEQRR